MRNAKNKPGTERHRDEKRKGGPRMHGDKWHDHEEPRAFTGNAEMAELDATPEIEASGDRQGMGKRPNKQRMPQNRSRR